MGRADFICADVYNLPAYFSGQFDVVNAEGGILAWLPDMRAFARVVAGCLRPGGIFYIRDSHPFRRVIFPVVVDGHGELKLYHYFSQEPIGIDMRGSYAQTDTDTCHTVYFWVHGIGEIITELSGAGFHIEFLHEFPKVYDVFPTNIRLNQGQFEQHILHNWSIPDTISLRATLTGSR
ncbi:MAG: class I SAM-dependent methyltransferase [Omnitrophica WOR_2 bacterium]